MLFERVLVFNILLVIIIAENDTIDILLRFAMGRKCIVEEANKAKSERSGVVMMEGQKLSIAITTNLFVNNVVCYRDQTKLVDIRQGQVTQLMKLPKYTIIVPKSFNASTAKGSWVCTIQILESVEEQTNMDQPTNAFDEDNMNPHEPQCHFKVTVMEPLSQDWTQNNWIIIGIPVATVITLIIIVQTGVIIYFKKKAFSFNRLQTLSMTMRNSMGNADDKRYSTQPGRKKSPPKQLPRVNDHGDSNHSIYETLNEVHGKGSPPVPPIENIPTLKKKKVEADTLRNRKPMPLPIADAPEPVPPKTPVSIKPQKSVNLKPHPQRSGDIAIHPKSKIGTLTAAEPILSELDHIFKRRQQGISNIQGSPSPMPYRKNTKPDPIPQRLQNIKPVVPDKIPPAAVKHNVVLPKSRPSAPMISTQPNHKMPAPLPVTSAPAVHPPSTLSAAESIYEEYDSDEEWNYEPLPKFNIYSS